MPALKESYNSHLMCRHRSALIPSGCANAASNLRGGRLTGTLEMSSLEEQGVGVSALPAGASLGNPPHLKKKKRLQSKRRFL